MSYELHFYGGEDDHHVIDSGNDSPQLTYGTIRAGDGGKIVAALTEDNLWNVPDVGNFTDVVICWND